MESLNTAEIVHGSCIFSSRLEASWALFFDRLKIKWRYMGQERHESTGARLPTFWVEYRNGTPGQESGCWIDVRVEEPSGSEMAQIQQLCELANCNVHVFVGFPAQHDWFLLQPGAGMKRVPDWYPDKKRQHPAWRAHMLCAYPLWSRVSSIHAAFPDDILRSSKNWVRVLDEAILAAQQTSFES